MLLGQFLQPPANPPLFVVDACFIPLRRAWLLHQPASVSFRVAPFAAQMLHRPSLARRAYQFFRLMSFSASISMASCGVCRFLFIESSRPLGPLDSHISWYIWRGSGHPGSFEANLSCTRTREHL